MDRFVEHLKVVSLPCALACACVGLVLLLMLPGRIRLQTALAAMVVVLTISRLAEIGPVASLAKVLSGLSFVLLAIAAYLQPGKRMPIPKVCWGYVLVGTAAIWCVIETEDRSLAIVVRVQWLMLTVSALLCVRTVVDERSLRRVLYGVYCGCCVSCLITFSAIAVAPIQALQNGFGRFMPYQANPNQIGILFAVTTALGMYFSLRTRSSLARVCYIGCTAIALGQCVLTLSRGSFLVIALAATPSVFVALRRPVFAIVSLGCLGAVLVCLMRVVESSDYERIGVGVEDRSALTLAVLDEVKERPLFGLANTEGLEAYNPDLNAHNAYVEMLYLGGISLGGPLIALQLLGHWSMVRVWLVRRRFPVDPLLLSVLAGFSAALFVHGFVNDMIFYPTFSWAFLNVFIACLFITLGSHVARLNVAPERLPRHEPRQRMHLNHSTRGHKERGKRLHSTFPLRSLRPPVST
ncbi:MAG: O-antigen ligase family protein [Pirellulales bacterium]